MKKAEDAVIASSEGSKTAGGHRFCAFGQNFPWVHPDLFIFFP